jgi:aldehyde:ferredoxin oxidoreductase
MKGYTGRILEVDLSTRSFSVTGLDEEAARKFIGGSGLGARLLFDHNTLQADPLSPDNILVFAVGPLTGTPLFNTDRFDVISKSPLTGIFAESSAGGYWAGKFKKCGYDALVITGAASAPVYLSITAKGVVIKDARGFWGLDTFAATDALLAAEGPGAKAAVIGPAGENLVRIAGIVSDGRHGRVAGRCGLGAVMGAKRLKGVVVNGTGNVEVDDPETIRGINKRMAGLIRENMQHMKEAGTSVGLEASEALGNLPIKNWFQGPWPEGARRITGLTMAEKRLTGTYSCGNCAIRCGRVVRSQDGPYAGQEVAGPEYETLGLLGSNLLVDDLDGVIRCNELCNRYGLDTISVGGVIGFAIEACERGLLDSGATGGLKLAWGDSECVARLIEDIAARRNLGALLGEGVRRAAEELGPPAREFAAEIKGLEPPAHDGRAKFTAAIGMATSNRGACHLSGFAHDFEEGAVLEDLGTPPLTDRFTTEGKAENVFRMQNLMGMMDSLLVCKFALFGGLTVDPMIAALNAVTGWRMDREEFFTTGERIFAVKRLYNNRLGVSRLDDTLPARMLRLRRGGGTNHLPPLYEMLDEYYALRGWNELGGLCADRLAALGLEEYAGGNGGANNKNG